MQKSHRVLVLLLVIFGAANTILLTLQNKQKTPAAAPNVNFFHPFMQTAVVFLAQSLCFIPYLLYKACRPKKNFLEMSGFMRRQCPVYLPMVPGLMDLLASILAYVSLNLIAGSVWQISRGGVIITTSIFSRLCLSKKFTRGSVLGCSLAFLGITLVQIFEITLTDRQEEKIHSTGEQVVGVALLLVSLVFNTAALITEKLIFNKYNIHPLKMVFLEGLYALAGTSLLILVLNFVQCPDLGTMHQKCLLYQGRYYVENVFVFWEQISKNTELLLYILGLIVTIGISVPLAVTISKVINPVSRSLADVCRTVIIWGFCWWLTVQYGLDSEGKEINPEYNLENTDLKLNLLKAIGFALVIVGTLIYHEIINVFRREEDVKESLLLGEESEENMGNYNANSSKSDEHGDSGRKSASPLKPRQSLM